MTPAPALTEATMDKMTVEKIAFIRSNAELGDDFDIIALCDLAKLALTPPQAVAGLVEELAGWIADCTVSEVDGDAIEPVRKARDALLSLSARNRELEEENARLTNLALTDEMINAAMDAAEGHFDIDGDKGPWLRSTGWQAAFQAIRALIPQEQGEKGK